MVAIYGKEKQYKAFANPLDLTISCTCKKSETHGLLCSHAIKVLDTLDIKVIPDKYILKRWTKMVRDGCVIIFMENKLKRIQSYRFQIAINFCA